MDGIIIIHELNQFYYAIVPEHLPAILEECFSIVANVVAAAATVTAIAISIVTIFKTIISPKRLVRMKRNRRRGNFFRHFVVQIAYVAH